jgi:hypothetical protein
VLLSTGAVAHALAGHRLATTQLTGLLLVGQVVTHAVSPPAHAGSDLPMLLAHVAGTAATPVPVPVETSRAHEGARLASAIARRGPPDGR